MIRKAHIYVMSTDSTCVATFEMEVLIPVIAIDEYRTKISALYYSMIGYAGKIVVKFEGE